MSDRLLLLSPRLILRPFREVDLPRFAAYRSDPDVARYQSWNAPYTDAQARLFLRGLEGVDPVAPDGWYQLAIERKDTGEMIGDCAYCVTADVQEAAEIGFTLAADSQGEGFATEAVRRLLNFLFDELGVERVRANCDARNERSRRLLERLGMVRAGDEERAYFKGEWCVEQWYGICKVNWQVRNNAAQGDTVPKQPC